jgi:hypothetical protein
MEIQVGRKYIKVWDMEDKKKIQILKGNDLETIYCLRYKNFKEVLTKLIKILSIKDRKKRNQLYDYFIFRLGNIHCGSLIYTYKLK